MALQTLPTELVLEIMDQLQRVELYAEDQRATAALARTCKHMYSIVNPRLYSRYGFQAFYIALSTISATLHAPATFQLACEHGVDINAPQRALGSSRPQTPLEMAILGMSESSCLHLLERGADVHNANYLNLACHRGMVRVVDELLRRGVDVNGKPWKEPIRYDPDRRYTRYRAIPSDYWQIPSKPCGTPLHTALRQAGATPLRKKHETIAHRLLDEGADIQVVDSFRARTPLHVAALTGMPSVVSRLIKMGADVNAIAYGHIRPLVDASSGYKRTMEWAGLARLPANEDDYVRVFRILIDAGGHFWWKGETPRQVEVMTQFTGRQQRILQHVLREHL